MDQELTYKWIQERLQQLSSGTLSEQDRLRLQELARYDPFVADALEGFHSHQDVAHTELLKALADKIRQPVRKRRRWLIPNLTVTAIAASLILLIATYAIIVRIDTKESESFVIFVEPDSLLSTDSLEETISMANDKSMTTVEKEVKQPIRKDALNDSRNESASRSKQADQSNYTGESETGKLTQAQRAEPDEKTPVTIEEPLPHPVLTESIEDATQVPPGAETKTAILSRNEGYYANQIDPSLMARRVMGRIIDPEGQPLIGAQMIVRNTNLGTSSDLNGRFELYLPLPEAEVEIYMSGYDETNVLLRQGEEEAIITLPASRDKKMESIAAGNAGQSQKDQSTKNDEAALVRPEESGIRLSNYLRENSKFPLRDNFYDPGKDVTLEFSIVKEGTTEDIKIISSSGDKTYDDEAVRLIRKSLDWVCEGGSYPCTRRYTIYFQ